MKKMIMGFGLALLTGCAANDPITMNMLTQHGYIRVTPADNADYDYRMTIRAARDFGYNLNHKADRITLAKAYFEHQCNDNVTI